MVGRKQYASSRYWKAGGWLAGIVSLLAAMGVPASAYAVDLSEASKAVVKLYVTHQSWDMKQPWTKNRSVSSTCSGFFIEQGILTNAHCLTDSTYIQVELPGIADKVEAVRKAVNHQIDLALIELKDPSQYPDITPIKFDQLPEMRDKVVTVGYPSGGRQVSYTEGVVSRIDVMSYAYSNVNSLMVQTDAAINSGNSGGPVFSDRTGASLGVATQRSSRGEAIGYFIPTPVIEEAPAVTEEIPQAEEAAPPSTPNIPPVSPGGSETPPPGQPPLNVDPDVPGVYTKLFDDIVRKVQDKMQPLKRTQKIIEKRGGEISEDSNAYLNEELLHGRTHAAIMQLWREHVDPLTKALNNSNVTYDELSAFLYAKHAPVRNAIIAERNPDIREGGSYGQCCGL